VKVQISRNHPCRSDRSVSRISLYLTSTVCAPDGAFPISSFLSFVYLYTDRFFPRLYSNEISSPQLSHNGTYLVPGSRALNIEEESQPRSRFRPQLSASPLQGWSTGWARGLLRRCRLTDVSYASNKQVGFGLLQESASMPAIPSRKGEGLYRGNMMRSAGGCNVFGHLDHIRLAALRGSYLASTSPPRLTYLLLPGQPLDGM